jgi:hypothetical protein
MIMQTVPIPELSMTCKRIIGIISDMAMIKIGV